MPELVTRIVQGAGRHLRRVDELPFTWSLSPSGSLKPRQPFSAGDTSIPSPWVGSPEYFRFSGRASVVPNTPDDAGTCVPQRMLPR
jgi:hypothetical protein